MNQFEVTSEAMHWLKVIGLGTVAGMRTMSAPALLSEHLNRTSAKTSDEPALRLLASSRTRSVLRLLAAAEMVGDKIPNIPARTSPPALLGRGLSGAVVGAALFRAESHHPAVGAAVGSLAAVVSAHGSLYLRRQIRSRLNLPDPVVGAMEDALIIGSGLISNSKL